VFYRNIVTIKNFLTGLEMQVVGIAVQSPG